MKLQLKRSATLDAGAPKAPSVSQLGYGEIAINYNSVAPTLFIKDSSNNVVGLNDQYLELAGGTLTGDLILNGDPTSALMPTTKQYTDSAVTAVANSINYPVTTVNGFAGAVVLNYSHVGAPSISGLNATGSWGIDITGNSATATQFQTSRNIILTGDVSGTCAFDGTGDGTITATVADDSHNHIIGNVDGLQAALNAKQDSSSAIANSLALNGKTDSQFVQTANNSSLNGDTRNTLGVTRLYRRDSNSDYSVQTYWTGSFWRITGYYGDVYHQECSVGRADAWSTARTLSLGGDASGSVAWDGSANATLTVNISSIIGNLNVQGSITATNDVTAFSDAVLKKDIEPITDALNKVNRIRGVTFTRLDMEEGQRYAGVIAQEIEEVLPEVVREGLNGLRTVAYGNIVSLLIEAIKELSQEVKTLKGE